MTEGSSPHQSNPFATKFIRAGEIPYRFPEGSSLESLTWRLKEASWRGQIVGPHGSGKSTLLKSLDDRWPTFGRQPITFRLQPQQRTLGTASRDWSPRDWSPRTQVIVDGYQQLALISKCRLHVCCRRLRCGLLITTHQASVLGPPIVWRTETSAELAKSLVRALTGDRHTITDQVIEQHFHACQGNLRETLLHLYDEFGKQQV